MPRGELRGSGYYDFFNELDAVLEAKAKGEIQEGDPVTQDQIIDTATQELYDKYGKEEVDKVHEEFKGMTHQMLLFTQALEIRRLQRLIEQMQVLTDSEAMLDDTGTDTGREEETDSV